MLQSKIKNGLNFKLNIKLLCIIIGLLIIKIYQKRTGRILRENHVRDKDRQ